jgi:hypothetical protein
MTKPKVQDEVFKSFVFSAIKKKDFNSTVKIDFRDNQHINSLDFLTKQYGKVFGASASDVLTSVSKYSSGNISEKAKIIDAIDTNVI